MPSAQAIAPSPSSQGFFSVILLEGSVGSTVYQYHWFPCVVYFSIWKYSEKGFVVHQTAREIHGAKRKGLSVKWILTYSQPSDDVEFQKTGSIFVTAFFSYLISTWSPVTLSIWGTLLVWGRLLPRWVLIFCHWPSHLIPWSVVTSVVTLQPGVLGAKEALCSGTLALLPWLRFQQHFSLWSSIYTEILKVCSRISRLGKGCSPRLPFSPCSDPPGPPAFFQDS